MNTFYPPVDVTETRHQLIVTVDVIGVREEDFTIEVDDDQLVVSGKTPACDFRRIVRLINAFDTEHIESYVDGEAVQVRLNKRNLH